MAQGKRRRHSQILDNMPPIKSTMAKIGSTIADALASVTNYQVPATNPPVAQDVLSPERIKSEIAFRESGTSAEPYKTVGVTGDYGKYQVSLPTLNTWAKKFLGKTVSADEFLNDPLLQEKFMEETIKHLASNGAKSLDAFLILHHRGWGNFSAKRIRDLKQTAEVQKYLNNRRSTIPTS
jgi:hypothetical protein